MKNSSLALRSLRAEAGDFAFHADIDEAADELEDLAESVRASPYLRPGWFIAWSEAFGGRDRLAVATVRRGGGLVAGIPVLRKRGVLESPTNWHTPAYGALTADEAAADRLARGLLAAAPSLLDLSFMDPDDDYFAACLAQIRSSRRRLIARPVLRSPFIDLEGNFEAYTHRLEGKFRRETQRRQRKLEAQGEVAVQVADGRERLEGLLDEGFRIEGSGWKKEQGTAIDSRPETNSFYRLVAAWAASRGMLELRFLRVDGRAIAFTMGLVSGRALQVLKVGYDPAWARFAPGTLLTYAAIKQAYDAGLERYDFLGGPDAYKLDWTSQVKERFRVQAFGATPAGFVAHAAWHYGRPIAKRAIEAYAKCRAR